jgi:hypothetical protein
MRYSPISSLEKPFACLDVSDLYDDEILADAAGQRNGTATLVTFPSLVGESKLFIAFVADEVRALATVALLVFITAKTGVKVS